MRLPPRQVRILEILESSKRNMSAAELTEATGAHRLVVSRDLLELTKRGAVKRTPGQGHSYEYRFKSFKAGPPVGQSLDVPQIEALNAQEVGSIYRGVTREGWEPKIFLSVGRMPEIISRLFELAQSAAEGEAISKPELDALKLRVQEMLMDINSLQKVVGGLFVTDRLWDPATLGSFLSDLK